jgi:ribose transport system ATP-binding protein
MLSLKDINKSFSGNQVLFDISAEIENKKVTAFIGENGAGKSTLMNIISGSITDYNGSVFLDNNLSKPRNVKEAVDNGITIIHQELNILPDLTAGENIFLGREPVKAGIINYSLLYKKADEILKQFKFQWPSDIKMRHLSIGWQQIVEIARALSLNTQVIIMDEPTSALSGSETDILFEKIKFLKEDGKTCLFISHRISEVLEISDYIFVMRDGRISAGVNTADTTREELIRYMAGEKKSIVSEAVVNRRSEEILKLANVNVPDSIIPLSGINFTLHKGEILGVSGLLGSGRTELLKFIFGESGSRFEGNIFLKGKYYFPKSATHSIKNKIIYLPENRKEEGIFADHSLLFNAGISVLRKFQHGIFLNSDSEGQQVEEKFNRLNIRRNNLLQEIKTLSGGNQQKVLLSRILLTDPEVILMDDPTRGIDIASKEEIYELMYSIARQGISVLFTSSEITELLRICSRILILSNGNQTALLETNGLSTQDILGYAFQKL